MKPQRFTVMINGVPIGFASDVVSDPPGWWAAFQPLPAFAEYKELFGFCDRAYDEHRFNELSRLYREIDKLCINIVDECGDVWFSNQTGDDLSVNPMVMAGIRDREIRWRQGPRVAK